MKSFKIIVGFALAFIVSIINGISGVGYVVGGEFEISFQAAVENEAETDSRWENRKDDDKLFKSPKDGLAALSLLLETKFGRFGLLLQVLCLLQFIGGLIVIFRSSTKAAALIFLILVALAGILVEVVGANYSSAWGVTNIFGIIVSVTLIPVAINMYGATIREN
ncbi:MAG: hypothetical protein QNJ18_19680 [Xenococcaceae cyanobacterium MO_167.B52]|nr:hypothetical protein [Xenococcaceae cyanobacterium MO_167.B52]